jgi:hypothetical protein
MTRVSFDQWLAVRGIQKPALPSARRSFFYGALAALLIPAGGTGLLVIGWLAWQRHQQSDRLRRLEYAYRNNSEPATGAI